MEDAIPIIVHMGEKASETPIWLQPSVITGIVTALVAILVLLVNARINTRMHKEKLAADANLAERKFAFDKELAEIKFRLDRDLADWKLKVDLAQNELASFYEMQKILEEVRSPMAYQGENDDRPGRAEEGEELRRNRDSYYPALGRLNRYSDKFNGFYSRRYQAQTLFGPEADVPYRGIWSALTQVRVAGQTLMRPDIFLENAGARERRDRMEAKIWEGATDGPDLVKAEVDEAVRLAEALFQPVIANKPVNATVPPQPEADRPI